MSWFDPSAWVPDVIGQPTAVNDGSVLSAKPPRTRRDSEKKGCRVCGQQSGLNRLWGLTLMAYFNTLSSY